MMINCSSNNETFHDNPASADSVRPRNSMSLDNMCSVLYKNPNDILLQGVNFVRSRVLPSGNVCNYEFQTRRKSAVELLAESKSQYVKTDSVLNNNQLLKNWQSLHIFDSHNKVSDVATDPVTPRKMSLPNLRLPAANTQRSVFRGSTPHLPEGAASPLVQSRLHTERNCGNEIFMESEDCDACNCYQSLECMADSNVASEDMEVDVEVKPLDWRERPLCSFSDVDSYRDDESDIREDISDCVQIKQYLPKPVQRSKSDLTHRYSHTGSDLSDIGSKRSRNSTDLEKFFNEMGLEKSVLEPMLKATKKDSHLKCYDSVSSVASPDARSVASRKSLQEGKSATEKPIGPMNIIERDARIIKWLCNVKKARSKSTAN
ncbi:uncharacterized protein LOC141899430 [Tubulanus polymorphus]|uniref:uncharacterized protein LOC141899430 n=1 Tax=Tubulanus polymorphus TaxID=672921 RepID=UPI003DA601E6